MRQIGAPAAVANRVVDFPMKLVAAGSGDYIHRARGSQIVREIEVRLAELKFLDAAGRNVSSSRSDRFIGDVDAVHRNARRAPEASAEGNGRIADLGRIEVGAVLNLHARLELCEVQEVAPVDGQIVDLLGADHALHNRLLRVDADRAACDFYHFGGRTKFDLETPVRRSADLNRQAEIRDPKPFGLDTNLIVAWYERSRAVVAGVGCRGLDYLAGRLTGDRDRRPRNGRTCRVRHRTLDTARGNRRLRNCYYRRARENQKKSSIFAHTPLLSQSLGELDGFAIKQPIPFGL